MAEFFGSGGDHRRSAVSHQLSRTLFPVFTNLAVLVLAACGAHDDGSNASFSDSGSNSHITGGSSGLGGGSGVGGPAYQGGGTGNAQSNDGLPCDVRALVKKSCSMCHGATPLFGAEFSLLTAADVREHGPKILERIADDQKPMPQPPNPRLTTDERAILTQYINAGAPASTCADSSPSGSGGAGGSGNASGGSGSGGSGGMSSAQKDPSVTCYNLVARASAANDKYSVPTTPDLYECFNFTPPWGNKKVQLVSTRPLIDNAKVLHHWLLYNSDAAVTDGSHTDCIGAHPNSSLVAGWAPGGEAFEAPPDVGVQVATGGFTLETHYNNKTGAAAPDASGVEVCVTDKMRTNEAAMHWLGTQNLNKQVASGTCVPMNTGDVTILRSTPHMHLQGRHMTTVINRAGGGTEMLLDKPFDFQTQISYSTPQVIHKGDTLTTSCTYATPTPFGEKTTDEMCYNFVLAYPAGGLAQFLQILRKYDCSG